MTLLNLALIIIFCGIFYLYGILLSTIIDHLFPDIETKHDSVIMIETFSEIFVTYLIYYFIYHYLIERIVYKMFININMYFPPFMNVILVLIFSSGLFEYLSKYSKKTEYLKNKYLKI